LDVLRRRSDRRQLFDGIARQAHTEERHANDHKENNDREDNPPSEVPRHPLPVPVFGLPIGRPFASRLNAIVGQRTGGDVSPKMASHLTPSRD
jgi:hypothetical protein